MIPMFDNLPPLTKYALVGVLSFSLGLSGNKVLELLNVSSQTTDIPLVVKSGATQKPIPDAEVKVLINGAPIRMKTDSNGYAHTQITGKKESVNIEINSKGYLTKPETLNTSGKIEHPFPVSLEIDRQASNCFGDSCTGRIPRAAKCDADVTGLNYATGDKFLRSGNISDVTRIEIRFSQNCGAVWAKAVAPPGAVIYLEDDKGSKLIDYTIPDDDLPDHHTEMLSRNLRLRACVQSGKGEKKPACTGFVD
jgi:hypothetical protein